MINSGKNYIGDVVNENLSDLFLTLDLKYIDQENLKKIIFSKKIRETDQ